MDNVIRFINNHRFEGDSQNINNIIEREKTEVIHKYEQLLEKIVIEYNKLHMKNKELHHNLKAEH